jgi:hypothetical protein
LRLRQHEQFGLRWQELHMYVPRGRKGRLLAGRSGVQHWRHSMDAVCHDFCDAPNSCRCLIRPMLYYLTPEYQTPLARAFISSFTTWKALPTSSFAPVCFFLKLVRDLESETRRSTLILSSRAPRSWTHPRASNELTTGHWLRSRWSRPAEERPVCHWTILHGGGHWLHPVVQLWILAHIWTLLQQ